MLRLILLQECDTSYHCLFIHLVYLDTSSDTLKQGKRELAPQMFPELLQASKNAAGVTLIVQVVPIGGFTTPPTRLMGPEPAGAVTAPPHVSVKPFGVATTTPAGNVSVKARPVTATPSLFVILKVSVEMPPGTILFGVKLLLKLGAGTAATSVVVAAAPVGR